MGKKKQSRTAQKPSPRNQRFTLEESPWFAPGAFVVLFVGLVILFHEFVFSNKMLHGSDMIQAGIFFRSYLVDFVHQHGAVPRWNPYIFGGMPYIEAFHGDIFYPLSTLKFFGNIYRMLGWVQFWHIFLAGVFMYLTVRQFKISKIPSLVAAAGYMFAAYLVSFVSPGHDGKIFVTALFPLVILFLDRGFERRSIFDFSMLGLVIGVIILSPHPQMSYFMLWALSFFAAFRLVELWYEKRKFGLLVKPALLTAYAVVIGLLLSAIQFYPGYIYTNEFSPRADTKRGWDWATSWSMHEEEAMALLIPEFPGASTNEANTFYWGENMFKDNSEAVGAVTFFLALIGAFFARRREAYFFTGLAVFALLYALGGTTPFFYVFFYLIPKVQALRAPSMIMFLFSFSAAMLAAMGLQRLRDAREKKEVKEPSNKFDKFLIGYPGILLLLALAFSAAGRGIIDFWTSLFYSDAARTQVQQGITKLDLAYRNLPAIQSGAWLAFFFVALAAACIWLYRSRKAGPIILAGLVLIVMVDGVRFGSRFVKTYDQDRSWAPNVITDFFTQREKPYRVMNFGVLPEDLLPYHGIEVVVGYHGNQLRWYDQLLGGPQQQTMRDRGRLTRLLNLVGAQYLLVPGQQKEMFQNLQVGSQSLSVAADFGQAAVMQNPNAYPRAYLVDRYRVFDDRSALVDSVLTGTEDLQKIVYLEQEPELDVPRDMTGADSVWIIEHQPDTVRLGFSVASNKLLVLTDNWYDAWQVTLDNRPAEVLRAYGSFRAVAIPAGTGEALFVFKSDRYRVGKLVTTLTTIFLAVVLGFYLIQGYRGRKREEEPEE